MVRTQKFDLDTDTTLGGNNASDYIAPSQKAIKDYVDNHSGGGSSLPSQTGNSGKFLTTDGSNASWENIPPGAFIAEYNTTLFDDIYSAYQNGQVVLCTYNSAIYYIGAVISSQIQFFRTYNYGIDIITVTKNSGFADSWNRFYDSAVKTVNNVAPVNGNVTLSIPQQVQANWNETDTSSKAYIQNKPSIASPIPIDYSGV